MPRRARLDVPEALQHVMLRGIEKRRIVNDVADRKNFVGRLASLASGTQTSIYAWALLTDHAHILLRSPQNGLSGFMRKLLTGYAIAYNRRHQRTGPLFQNRYKSIICEEKAYFKELVRYIHLNPLRAKSVKNLSQLDRYRWCGHGVLMGNIKNEWQDRDTVLRSFGSGQDEARKAYRRYVNQGIAYGRRPELVGGGLIRSQGGWPAVKAMRRSGDRELSDDRILGSGEFVARIIKAADGNNKRQRPLKAQHQKIDNLITRLCKSEKVAIEELVAGSRRKAVSGVRASIAIGLVKNHGMALADVARRVGVSTAAVSKIISRSGQ